MSNLAKIGAKTVAVELFALKPAISLKDVATNVGVSLETIKRWRKDPNFHDAIYDRYMIEFGSELPSVLNATLREAKAGNVQAARLILEHSGRLVKNVNVTIDSPYEKFLKKIDVVDAEIVEDDAIIELVEDLPEDSELPPRNDENQQVRVTNEKKALKESIKRQQYNEKQKEWYNWRKRAKKVGIQPLKGKRPTPGQRENWQNKIVAAELAVID